MKMNHKIHPAACLTVFLTAVSLILHLMARHMSGFADAYMEIMNPVMTGTEGRLAGFLPFSLGEALIALLLLFILIRAVRLVRAGLAFLRNRKNKIENRRQSSDKDAAAGRERKGPRRLFRRICLLLSVILLLFVLNEDIYFSAASFAETYDLESMEYSDQDLISVCQYLGNEINTCADRVSRDDRGIMVLAEDPADKVRSSLRQLGEEYPRLRGFYPRPKRVLCSFVLSYAGFTGIYSVITCEANYNRDMPAYNIPFTIGHELAHLKGVMSEKEANFIGYLACIRSEDPDLRYSGAVLGFIYCANELKKRDPEAWKAVHEALDEDAMRDIIWNSAFWDAYEGSVSETADRLNDTYLKTEGLEAGTASYDQVVDMIVTYTKRRE